MREATIDLMLRVTPPLNVRLIRWVMGKTRMPWPAAAFITAFVASVPTLVWAAASINTPTHHPIDLALGFLTLFVMSFVSLAAAWQYYATGMQALPSIIRLLEPDDIAEQVVPWLDRFRPRGQFPIIFTLGLIMAVTSILPDIQLGAGPFILAIGALSALLPGIFNGSNVHFYVNFLEITPIVLAGKVKLNRLFPAESTGLRAIFSLGLRFTVIFSVISTVMLTFIVAYLAALQSMPLSIQVVVAASYLILVWCLAAFTVLQVVVPVDQVIRWQKDRILDELQGMINARHDELAGKGQAKDSVEEIEKLMTLYASVKKGPSLPIDLEVVSRFVVSFLFPILPIAINFIRK